MVRTSVSSSGYISFQSIRNFLSPVSFHGCNVILESIPEKLDKFSSPLTTNLLFSQDGFHLECLVSKLRRRNYAKHRIASAEYRSLISRGSLYLRHHNRNDLILELSGIARLVSQASFILFLSQINFAHVSTISIEQCFTNVILLVQNSPAGIIKSNQLFLGLIGKTKCRNFGSGHGYGPQID
ncbi:hypothetical protein D3C81_1119380 [compost metagenome]